MLKASNNLIKDIKKQKHENRYLLFLDNVKIIKDALKMGLKYKYLFLENDKLNIFDFQENVYLVDRKTIEQLSDSKTPQGVVCVVEYIPNILEKPKTNFLVIDGLQDPGNVGTLIRTATACGFEYVFLLDSVHITNSKLIRSSVGTVFQNHIIEMPRENFIKQIKQWKFDLLKADMNGENIFKFNNSGILGVVVGNEGQGVSEELSLICKYSVSIPMLNNVESLNASVSGSIIMYELSKQNFLK